MAGILNPTIILNPLFEYAEAGNVEAIRGIAADSLPKALKARDEDQRTALHRACVAGHQAVAELLLEKGADPDLADEAGWNPLHSCASKGDAQLVELLLEKRADADAATNTKAAALHFAASKGHLQAVELLLNAGAQKNTKDKQGGTALLRAVGRGHVDVTRALLAAKVNIKLRDSAGDNVLHVAINGHHPGVCQLLMPCEDAEAMMTQENEDNKTPASLLLETQPMEMRETLKSIWRRRDENQAAP